MPKRQTRPLAETASQCDVVQRSVRILPSYAARITELGMALFGSTWQTELSRALRLYHPEGLDIGPVTVRKWAAGTRRPPQWMWDALPAIIRQRIEELERVATRLVDEPPWLVARKAT